MDQTTQRLMSGAAGAGGGVDTNTSGWKILMMTDFPRMITGNEAGSGEWMDPNSVPAARRAKFGTSTGSGDYTNDNSWKDITMANTGAENRVESGDGHGLYKAFFECEDISKIGYVAFPSGATIPTDLTDQLNSAASGTGFSSDTYFSTHSIKIRTYTLMQGNSSSNVSGTVFENLLAINNKLRAGSPGSYNQAHNKDNIFGTRSTQDLTAHSSNTEGGSTAGYDYSYDGLDNSNNFCFWGINRDSDNDTQALCFFGGSLHSGKGDSWRGADTHSTLWSYWGDDFHSDSKKHRIGYGVQTTPGISGGTGNSNTDYSSSIGDFYLIGKK